MVPLLAVNARPQLARNARALSEPCPLATGTTYLKDLNWTNLEDSSPILNEIKLQALRHLRSNTGLDHNVWKLQSDISEAIPEYKTIYVSGCYNFCSKIFAMPSGFKLNQDRTQDSYKLRQCCVPSSYEDATLGNWTFTFVKEIFNVAKNEREYESKTLSPVDVVLKDFRVTKCERRIQLHLKK